MDLNSSRLCRLCLKSADDLVNIFDSVQGSTIAAVLTQHFWFQVTKNDGFPECVCEICWIQTKTFHNFYKRVQWLHKDYTGNLYGVDTVLCADLIKQERTDAELQPDILIVKCGITQPSPEMNDLQMSKKENCDLNDDNGSEKSNMQISQITYDSASKEREVDIVGDNDVTENEFTTPDIECTRSSEEDDVDDNPKKSNLESTNQSVRDEEDAQLQEFCDMSCSICPDPILQFESFRKVKEHYRKVHEKRGYVTCCGKKFLYRYRALNHIKNHLDPDAYRCEPCGKRFLTKFTLEEHMKNVHTTNSSEPEHEHKCKVCAKTFKTSKLLAYHERSKHVPETEKNVQCDKCEKKFSTEVSMRTHTRVVHEAIYSQICDICAQVFKSKASLRNHVESSHSTTPPSKVQCNICGAWLKRESRLKRHMKELHGEDSVSSICPICKKVLKNKPSMLDHIRRAHRNGRSHQCTMCHKAFRTNINLKEHIATHTGEDLYSCDYCDKKFKSNGNKCKHRKAAHFAEWSRDRPDRTLLEKTSTKILTDSESKLL